MKFIESLFYKFFTFSDNKPLVVRALLFTILIFTMTAGAFVLLIAGICACVLIVGLMWHALTYVLGDIGSGLLIAFLVVFGVIYAMLRDEDKNKQLCSSDDSPQINEIPWDYNGNGDE